MIIECKNPGACMGAVSKSNSLPFSTIWTVDMGSCDENALGESVFKATGIWNGIGLGCNVAPEVPCDAFGIDLAAESNPAAQCLVYALGSSEAVEVV